MSDRTYVTGLMSIHDTAWCSLCEEEVDAVIRIDHSIFACHKCLSSLLNELDEAREKASTRKLARMGVI